MEDPLLLKALKALEEVRETQRLHKKMLNALVKFGRGSNVTAGTLPEGTTFPLDTMTEFRRVEIKLQEPDFADRVVSY